MVFLGAGAITGTVGLINLASSGKDAPGSLIAIVSACYGNLASFLVMPPRGSAGAGDQQKGPGT